MLAMKYKRWTTKGFTIVELLIVIVVIAILAAISIVAYTGIQQRSNNAATISKAKQVVKLVKAQQAILGGGSVSGTSNQCMTLDNECTSDTGTALTSSNTNIVNALSDVGQLPASTTAEAGGKYGVRYNHWTVRTFNGVVTPMQVTYFLQGNAVKCELANIRHQNEQHANTSTTGYTATDGSSTTCVVSILE